ncbi:peptidase M48 [Methanocella sp. CWC-04]|uniref:Protease HtpX homolog n=1 Tax=Methanooceanicella nereidis TaxID=2052831 RepID=A0AAP2W7E4_9EURY|nr:M48 family metalloprotease [Methanocella sp. CWC-04]MCD1294986.1 peptidase M48 [Methanocella sp. CWC-04]
MYTKWGMTIRKIFVYGTLFVLLFLAVGVLIYFNVSPFLIALLSGGFLFIQYFFSDKLVLWSTGAKVVKDVEAPALHAIIEKLCSQMGLPKPRIAIMQNDMPNAFATGRNRKNAVVAVTTGILRVLNERELEGVLAHELSHIKNRDMFVVTFASFVVSLVSFVIYILLSSFMARGSDSSYGSSYTAWMISILLSNTLGVILVNTISRYREYGADRGAAYATGNPDGLINALKKISGARYSPSSVSSLTSAKCLCIQSLTGRGLMELFSTHPPIEKRIAELERIRSEIRGY